MHVVCPDWQNVTEKLNLFGPVEQNKWQRHPTQDFEERYLVDTEDGCSQPAVWRHYQHSKRKKITKIKKKVLELKVDSS